MAKTEEFNSMKRSFSDEIMMSDAFLSMRSDACVLYIALNYQADNDGIVNNIKLTERMLNADPTAYEQLVAKGFMIDFPNSNIGVIKHWWVHNIKRNDRYKPTKYTEIIQELDIKDNAVYTKRTTKKSKMATKRQPPARVMSNSNSNSNTSSNTIPKVETIPTQISKPISPKPTVSEIDGIIANIERMKKDNKPNQQEEPADKQGDKF